MTDPSEPGDGVNGDSAVFSDVSPLADVEDHTPEVDGGESAVFADISPLADPEEDAPQPSSTPPTPKTMKKEDFTLPERRVARPPKQDLPQTGFAVCPACQAKNEAQALRCMRCGAEIPPAIPNQKVKVAGILGVARGRRTFAPVDEDVVPAHVRAGWDQDAEQREQLSLEHLARRDEYCRRVMWIAAALYFFAGLMMGFPLGFVVVPLAAVYAAMGAAITNRLAKSGGGRVKGAFVYGGSMMVIGLVTTALAGIASLLVAIPAMVLGYGLGFMSGMAMELRRFDQEI